MTRRQLAGPRVGLRLLADGRRQPARGLRRHQRDEHVGFARPASGAPAPVMGGTLTGVIPPSITDIDPVTIYDQGGIVLVQQVCRVPDRPRQQERSQAEARRELVAQRRRGDVWTFKLRQGVTFNDGSPFEAADVVASIERVVDPKSGSGALAALAGILSPGGTKAVDTYTVEFNLDKPFADFPYLVCQSSYNTVILPRNYDGNFVKKPVGTGPFMLKQYNTKQQAVMVKNPTYWGKDASGNAAAVPRPGHLGHGRGRRRPPTCSCSPAPSTSSRRRCSRARRRCSPTRTCASTSTRRPASARSPSTSRRTPWKTLPRSSARPSPTASTARPSTRRSTAAAATSATTPSGSRRSSRAARRRPTRAQDYAKAKQLLSDRRASPAASTITLTVAKYLENPQLAQLIQAAVQAGRHQRQDQPDQLQRLLRRHRHHHAVAQRADGHRRVGQPAHAGRVRPGHAAAEQRRGAPRTGTTRTSSATFNQY